MSENWKNKPKLKDLKKDYDNSKTFRDYMVDEINNRIKLYKEETRDVKQRAGSERMKSRYTSNLIKKQLRWVIPNIEEPILATDALFKLNAKNIEAVEQTGINKDTLNHQWNIEVGKTSFINRSVRKFAIEGVTVTKIGWTVKTKKEKVATQKTIYTSDPARVNEILIKAQQDPEMFNKLKQMYEQQGQVPCGAEIVIDEKDIVIENRPKLEVRDNRAIIIDPKANGVWEDVKFVIDICETDYSTLKGNDSYFNLDYVKKYIESKFGDEYPTYNDIIDKDTEDYDTFQFSDLARKKITMYEYWGYWDVNGDGTLVSIVASWIGDKLVRLEENPFPHGEIPYAVATFEPDADLFIGESDVNLLEEDQKGMTGTIRAMQDITNDDAIGQEFIDGSIFESAVQRQNYEKGKTVWLRKNADPRNAIYRKETKPVPNVLFNMKQLYGEHATLLTGVEEMDGGAGSRKQQSLSGPPISTDAKTNREMGVLRRYSAMLERVGKLILSMNKEYLLTGYAYTKHNKIEIIKDIKALRDDFHVSTKVLTNAMSDAIAAKINFMLQTNGSHMSPKLAMIHYKDIAELWNREDLVRAVDNEMNQPPSEQEVMMQQLELERLKLENNKVKLEILTKTKEMEYKDALIAEKLGKLDTEIVKDKAKAELDLAQAEKMDAQVKLFNQEFELIDTGTKRKWEKEDNEFHHLANLEREEVRTAREQENIKLKEEKTSKEKNIDYIKEGTLENQSYDAADDIFRNILTKNSLDTKDITKDVPNIKRMPGTPQPMKKKGVKVENDIISQIPKGDIDASNI